ncbi:sialidase family protein [Paenibacillus cymbidii]|uniref:sialidase family protein n=1 Tax=Paenibacillus cymbidii TaxID=1639034 RepID=UPI00107FFB4E|nr:sialidase family protein [Paenibacillus cymbidii]
MAAHTEAGATAQPQAEWQRSNPDIIVYVPEEDVYTGDNEHFLVFESPGGDLLAVWTQSSKEAHGDNHLVLARSSDNVTWSKPSYLVGTKPGEKGGQASWGFPVVSDQGRIYIFYTKDIGVYDMHTQVSGAMGCLYSDDDGRTWTAGCDIPMGRTRNDHPDPSVPRNWIVWQKPIRDSKGRWVTGYTQNTSPAVRKPRFHWQETDTRSLFMRFDNIDEGPDPADLRITWLPEEGDGLEVPLPRDPSVSVAQEPSIVLLPDNRLFCVMRTFTGHIWYAVSGDDGATWTNPEPLLYRDGGEKVKQPIASCPVYPLGGEGRYMLLFHNNDGHLEDYTPYDANYNRRPAFVSVGTFQPDAHQPVWFAPPKQLMDTDGVVVGPKQTTEIATYPSLTTYKGKRVLWYPDRKYFLLGKYITDDLFE